MPFKSSLNQEKQKVQFPLVCYSVILNAQLNICFTDRMSNFTALVCFSNLLIGENQQTKLGFLCKSLWGGFGDKRPITNDILLGILFSYKALTPLMLAQ